jgi:DNA-binding transcriptional MerR regulator
MDSGANWSAGPSREAETLPSDPATLGIGDLAREFGVTLRTLRFYENKGLLAPRRAGQTRLYSQGDARRLGLILKAKKLGFTLSEIRRMIAAQEGGADSETLSLSREKCMEQIQLLEKQKAEIEQGIAELRRIHSSLAAK